jgi:hypothetical protein
MRVLRTSALLATLSSAALIACFSSTNNDLPPGNEATHPDASTIADAAGPEGSSPAPPGPDATVPDEAGMAPFDAGIALDAVAVSPPVTVLVEARGRPESGKIVVFSDATGAVIVTDVTNAQGLVVDEVPANSQATVVLGSPDTPNLVTVTGVQPGDQLTAIDTLLDRLQQSFPVVDVTLPPLPGNLGTVEDYEVQVGDCATFGDGNTGELELASICIGPHATIPLLARAQGPNSDLAFLFQNGNTLAVDGGVTTLSPTSAWGTTMGTEKVTIDGVSIDPSVALSYSEIASGVPFDIIDYQPAATETGYESTFDTHPGYPDFVQTEVRTASGDNTVTMVIAAASRDAATTTASPSASVSFQASDLPPTISDATLDTTDPLRPAVSWTPSAPFTAAIATFASIAWLDQTDAGDQVSGTWTVVVPAGQTTVQLPALPDALGVTGPSATSTWPTSNPAVATIGGPGFIGYDAVRATAAIVGTAIAYFNDPIMPPLLANGRAQLTLFSRQIPEVAGIRPAIRR